MLGIKRIVSALVFIAVFQDYSGFAQKGPCTEDSIRTEATSGRVPQTDDFYLFNPVMETPAVGKEEQDRAFAAIKANTELMANRKNFGGDARKLDRVVVSGSGDMAYAYGTSHISYNQKDGKHVDATHAFLWVFRADAGSCKLAASMVRREENPQQ